ncbi:hypothetical protein VNO77_42132 [Canavalia gladiata]|uniref:Uncharacterized protein n=1 Tax=Canavalia gladiata TaxID=3824 RepID=A0AAN9K262_CANGL
MAAGCTSTQATVSSMHINLELEYQFNLSSKHNTYAAPLCTLYHDAVQTWFDMSIVVLFKLINTKLDPAQSLRMLGQPVKQRPCKSWLLVGSSKEDATHNESINQHLAASLEDAIELELQWLFTWSSEIWMNKTRQAQPTHALGRIYPCRNLAKHALKHWLKLARKAAYDSQDPRFEPDGMQFLLIQFNSNQAWVKLKQKLYKLNHKHGLVALLVVHNLLDAGSRPPGGSFPFRTNKTTSEPC